MSTPSDKLVLKGRRVATSDVIGQIGYSLALWEKHAERLANHGFDRAKGAAMRELFERFSAAIGQQSVQHALARTKRRAEVAAISEARTFISKLAIIVPMALRDAPVPSVSGRTFRGVARLGRSSSRIVEYLAGNRKILRKLDEVLKPYFGGQSACALLDERLSALSDANGSQELARASAPLSTRELNEVKGRLIQLLEDLNAIGRLAFWDDPGISRQFDKHILQRGRRARRRRRPEEPAEETPDLPQLTEESGPSLEFLPDRATG